MVWLVISINCNPYIGPHYNPAASMCPILLQFQIKANSQYFYLLILREIEFTYFYLISVLVKNFEIFYLKVEYQLVFFLLWTLSMSVHSGQICLDFTNSFMSIYYLGSDEFDLFGNLIMNIHRSYFFRLVDQLSLWFEFDYLQITNIETLPNCQKN